MSKMADRPLNDFIKEQFEQEVFPFDRDIMSTVELFDYLKIEKRLKVTRIREVADALSLIGGVCKKQIPIATVCNRATVWIIRNHDDYKDLNGADLARKYVPFFDERR